MWRLIKSTVRKLCSWTACESEPYDIILPESLILVEFCTRRVAGLPRQCEPRARPNWKNPPGLPSHLAMCFAPTLESKLWIGPKVQILPKRIAGGEMCRGPWRSSLKGYIMYDVGGFSSRRQKTQIINAMANSATLSSKLVFEYSPFVLDRLSVAPLSSFTAIKLYAWLGLRNPVVHQNAYIRQAERRTSHRIMLVTTFTQGFRLKFQSSGRCANTSWVELLSRMAKRRAEWLV